MTHRLNTSNTITFDKSASPSISIQTQVISTDGSPLSITGQNTTDNYSDTGIGGDITLLAGSDNGISSGGAAGNINVTAGNSTGANGGVINITSGNGQGSGDVTIATGDATLYSAGIINILGGDGYGNSGTGGEINITAGRANHSSGAYTNGISGGDVTITGGGDGVNRFGGNIYLNGASGDTSYVGGSAGGYVIIESGQGYETGVADGNQSGDIIMTSKGAVSIEAEGVGRYLALEGEDIVFTSTSLGGIYNYGSTYFEQAFLMTRGASITSNTTLSSTISSLRSVYGVNPGVTVTLPATPTNGNIITFIDHAGGAQSSPIIIDGNGKTISGESTYTLNSTYGSVTVYYNGAGSNWVLLSYKFGKEIMFNKNTFQPTISQTDSTGAGTPFVIKAQSAPTSGNGGGMTISGGNAASGTGGNLNLQGGTGSTNNGAININNANNIVMSSKANFVFTATSTTGSASGMSVSLGSGYSGGTGNGGSFSVTTGIGYTSTAPDASISGTINLTSYGDTTLTSYRDLILDGNLKITRAINQTQGSIPSNATLDSNPYNTKSVYAVTAGVTVTLQASPVQGQIYTFYDNSGTAASSNIIIDGNGKNINGSSTYSINTNYGAVTMINGADTHWHVLSKGV